MDAQRQTGMLAADMTKPIESILVIGIGKVGALVGTLLHETGFKVRGLDMNPRTDRPFPIDKADIADTEAVKKAMEGSDAVVSCLPYNLTVTIAKLAHELDMHYFDLTEDVPTTKTVMELSKTSKGIMAPQCGLAPGFIGIVGASLTPGFKTLRSIELRVGALPRHPRGLLGYAFNWSAAGVVNEYLNDCEVIAHGKKASVPPMGALETIVIDGIRLEAFTTSGGLGTMCDTYEGRVDELNYKTMRYPGHCELMRFFFEELYMKERREDAGDILVNAKPPVNEDVVYIHAAVEGVKAGRMAREEFVRAYRPRQIAGRAWRAISWTTAASICAVVEMVSNGTLPQTGFLKQEDIPLADFLETKNGAMYKVD